MGLCLMYPRVKVRAVDQDDEYDRLRSPLQGFNSLSIRHSDPPVKGITHSSSISVAKVPRSYIPRSITPPPSLPKLVKTSEMEADATKPHIRASSIPRPRAVISSPDNDQILGSQSKMRFQRPIIQSRQSERKCSQTSTTSALKNHDLAQRRQSEGKCTRSNTVSALKNHDLAQNRQLEGKCIAISTTSTLKNHNLTQSRHPAGRCSRTSMTFKKPLKDGENQDSKHRSDAKLKQESAVDVKVPMTNICKAKPCFTIT